MKRLTGKVESKSGAGMRLRRLCLVALALASSSCSTDGPGRVAVILDNSSSMEQSGTPFETVKKSVFDSLMLLPGWNEVGLRVFAEEGGSRLIVPYARDLSGLRIALAGLQPSTGTYIGESLVDAARDLSERPEGGHRILLITDGEGTEEDFTAARQAGELLRQSLQNRVECDFVVFSQRKQEIESAYISEIADQLGCSVTVPDEGLTEASLRRTLQSVVGSGFYFIWIFVSAVLYLALLLLTASLVFSTQVARGVLPRLARLTGVSFFVCLLSLAAGAHLAALFEGRYDGLWWLAAVLGGGLASILLILGRSRALQGPNWKGAAHEDPFV